ncbi:MAG: hypothetical protein NZ928_04935 [Endomicrobia bacterium]|nr:hypothetical protein [Endomicrobiia bacterium]MDW8056128.1 hypothetical protein [Elusimicrobiota bacterium]
MKVKLKDILLKLCQPMLNEEETACIGMENILKLLNWNVLDINYVRRQYKLCQIPYKADYILHNKNINRPIIVIELKPAGGFGKEYLYGAELGFWRILDWQRIKHSLPKDESAQKSLFGLAKCAQIFDSIKYCILSTADNYLIWKRDTLRKPQTTISTENFPDPDIEIRFSTITHHYNNCKILNQFKILYSIIGFEKIIE